MRLLLPGVAVVAVLLGTLWWLLDNPVKQAPLCSKWIGPAAIVIDQSDSLAFVHGGQFEGLATVELGTGKIVDGVGYEGTFVAAASIPETGSLIVAHANGSELVISTVDARTRQIASRKSLSGLQVSLAIFSPDGAHLAGTSSDDNVFVVDLAQGTSRLSQLPVRSIASVAISNDGNTLYVAGNGLTVVNLQTLSAEKTISAERYFVDVATSRDGKKIAIRDALDVIDVVDADSMSLMRSHVASSRPDGSSSTSGRMSFSSGGEALYFFRSSFTEPTNLVRYLWEEDQFTVVAETPENSLAPTIAPHDDRMLLFIAGVVNEEELIGIDALSGQTNLRSRLKAAAPDKCM